MGNQWEKTNQELFNRWSIISLNSLSNRSTKWWRKVITEIHLDKVWFLKTSFLLRVLQNHHIQWMITKDNWNKCYWTQTKKYITKAVMIFTTLSGKLSKIEKASIKMSLISNWMIGLESGEPKETLKKMLKRDVELLNWGERRRNNQYFNNLFVAAALRKHPNLVGLSRR